MLETHLTPCIWYAISGISIRCYLYLNTSEISINDHFLHFWSCKLPQNKLNQCWKLFLKVISHLTSGMQYPAFSLVLKYIENRSKWSICFFSSHVNYPGINEINARNCAGNKYAIRHLVCNYWNFY